MVLYEKISTSKTVVNQHGSKSTDVPEVPVIKSDEPDIKTDYNDSKLPKLKNSIDFKVFINDGKTPAEFSTLVYQLPDESIRNFIFAYYKLNNLTVSGLNIHQLNKLKNLPYADRLIIGDIIYDAKGNKFEKGSARSYLELTGDHKLYLDIYFGYEDLYKKFETTNQGAMTRKLNDHNQLVYEEYMKYLEDKKKPTTTTTTTTTNPVNHGLPVKKQGSK